MYRSNLFLLGRLSLFFGLLLVPFLSVNAQTLDINASASGRMGSYGQYSLWSDALNATVANFSDTTEITANAQHAGTKYYNIRGWTTFDLSSLPSGAVVTSATITVDPTSVYDYGDAYSSIVLTCPVNFTSPLTPSTTEYFNTLEADCSDTIDYGSITPSTILTFTLNSTALTAINAAPPKIVFSFLDSHEAQNQVIPNNQQSGVSFSITGVQLHLTYSLSGSGSTIGCTLDNDCNLANTGSLLLFTNYCNDYQLLHNGSGDVIDEECAEWSTAIRIPAIKFTLDATTKIIMDIVQLIVIVTLSLIALYKLIRWFYSYLIIFLP